jgi:hypothetical protein
MTNDGHSQGIKGSIIGEVQLNKKSNVWGNIIDRSSADGYFLLVSTTFLYTDHLDYLSHSCCLHTDLH